MDELQEATEAAEKCVGLVGEILRTARYEGTDDTFAPIVAQTVRQLRSASKAATEAAAPHLSAFRTAIATPRPTVLGRTARSFHELAPLIAAGLLLDIKILTLGTAARQKRIPAWQATKAMMEDFPAILFDEIILTWPEVKLSLRTEAALAFDEEWLLAMIGTEHDNAAKDAAAFPSNPAAPAASKYYPVLLGENRVQVGDDDVIPLRSGQAAVLASLVDNSPSFTEDLSLLSGNPYPGRVLKELVKSHPQLGPYIEFPGKKGGKGYRTTIKRPAPQ